MIARLLLILVWLMLGAALVGGAWELGRPPFVGWWW